VSGAWSIKSAAATATYKPVQVRNIIAAAAAPPRRALKLGADPLAIEELQADFVVELRVALGLAARMVRFNETSTVAPRCVSGARVLVFVELFDPICVWSASVEGTLLTFCSCGGILGSGRHTFTGEKIEHVNLQVARDKSSTCRHARALQLAYDELAFEYEADSIDDLLDLFPDLAGTEKDQEAEEEKDTAVHLAFQSGKKEDVPIFAIMYESVWSPAIVRRRSNKQKLATCFLLSCSSRPWGCLHAQAVNEFNRLEAAAASGAAAQFNEALQFGPAGDLNEDGEEQPTDPAPPTLDAAAVSLPSRLRRAHNMFPCTNEVKQCDRYAAVVDACRTAGEAKVLDFTHAESKCLYCDTVRSVDTQVTPEEVVLYCIRGRLTIYIGSWLCGSCRRVVEYDGSANGLFVTKRGGVYARTFLDAVLELFVIARSTMAAASEFLTSLLRNTAAFSEDEPGQARQLLSDACAEFSSTLVIPETTFRCHHCGAEEHTSGRFRCVICDGQVLSVLQEHVVEMLRPGMNAPRVDFSLVFACAIRSAKVRRLVRNRVRAAIEDDTALTTAEATAWRVFQAARLGARLTGGRDVIAARTRTEKAAAQQWSSAILFNSFWDVIASVERQPAAVAAPGAAAFAPVAALRAPAVVGGAADDLAAAASDGSEEDDVAEEAAESDGSTVDLVAASGSPDCSAAAVGRSDVDLAGPTRCLSLDEPADTADGRPLFGTEHDGPADADEAQVPAAADEDGVVEMDADVVPRTPDAWRTPLLYIAHEMAPGANKLTVCDPMDPLSPLTPHAVSVTSQIRPYHGRARSASAEQEPLVVIDNIPLRLWDLRRVAPTVMLHDEPMNAYICLLQRRERVWAATKQRSLRFHFFNTFFFNTLTSGAEGAYNYDAVTRWSRQLDLKDYEAVFIPINLTDIHWLLAVVCPQRCVVHTYDSSGCASDWVVQCLVQWGKDELRAHGHRNGKWRSLKVPCRQQENGKDCGVFVLKRMDYISRGLPPERMTGSMNYYRRRTAAELLAMTLL